MNQQIAFIFDMDGTLIDNMQFHTQAWLTFLSDLGIDLSEEELQRYNHGTIEEVVRRICGSHLSDEEVAELGNRKEALYRKLYRPHLKPIAGVKQFLEQARQLNIPIAMGTSAGKHNIDFVLDGLEIASYFDVLVGGDDVKYGKPHPETFLIAAQRLNISPDRCIVFEDTLSGIEAAQNAKMMAIAVTTTLPTQAFEKLPAVRQIIPDYTSIHPRSLLSTSFECR